MGHLQGYQDPLAMRRDGCGSLRRLLTDQSRDGHGCFGRHRAKRPGSRSGKLLAGRHAARSGWWYLRIRLGHIAHKYAPDASRFEDGLVSDSPDRPRPPASMTRCRCCGKPFRNWHSLPMEHCSKACADQVRRTPGSLRPNIPPSARPRPLVKQAEPQPKGATLARPHRRLQSTAKPKAKHSVTAEAPPSITDAHLFTLKREDFHNLPAIIRQLHEVWPGQLYEVRADATARKIRHKLRRGAEACGLRVDWGVGFPTHPLVAWFRLRSNPTAPVASARPSAQRRSLKTPKAQPPSLPATDPMFASYNKQRMRKASAGFSARARTKGGRGTPPAKRYSLDKLSDTTRRRLTPHNPNRPVEFEDWR